MFYRVYICSIVIRNKSATAGYGKIAYQMEEALICVRILRSILKICFQSNRFHFLVITPIADKKIIQGDIWTFLRIMMLFVVTLWSGSVVRGVCGSVRIDKSHDTR